MVAIESPGMCGEFNLLISLSTVQSNVNVHGRINLFFREYLTQDRRSKMVCVIYSFAARFDIYRMR